LPSSADEMGIKVVYFAVSKIFRKIIIKFLYIIDKLSLW